MLHFDIFCRVIDNYGDIGVCWRLARQLATFPNNALVRLWVDDLYSFRKIEPSVQPSLAQQSVFNVDVRQWVENASDYPAPYDIVIEAFACELPASVSKQITPLHVWINLEYLSAESWVDEFHGLGSPQPEGQNKFFYFPGFNERTGGLLREHKLPEQRLAWKSQAANARSLWTKIGLSPKIQAELADARRQQILMFNYADAPVESLLLALQQEEQPALVLSPNAFTPAQYALASEHVVLHTFDFVDQQEFDRLLWISDLNIVRGEDSLLRALWADKPMIWQPYVQDENLHLAKLQALLDSSPLDTAIHKLWLYWASGDGTKFTEQYLHCRQPKEWLQWRKKARAWQSQLAEQSDLCTRLIAFCTQELRSR